VVVVVEELQE
jgi:hypothetical protein